MSVDLQGEGWRVFSGSCLDRLRELPDESVDAVVTDPPYGLSNTDPGHVSDALVRWVSGERDFIPDGKGFMGKAWDAFVPPPAVWDECLRVLKPGGHVLAFAGSRTFDLMALSIRLAGFEIRDSVAWLYGSGFPKSLDVSKAIDKTNGEGGRKLKFTRWFRTAGLSLKDVTAALRSASLISENGTMAGHFFASSNAGQPAIPTAKMWAVVRPMIADVPAWVDNLVERVEAERKVIGSQTQGKLAVAPGQDNDRSAIVLDITAPATAQAQKWQGWGTALKPAFEPVVVARKPLGGRTVAENVLLHGTGGLNIDGTRIGTEDNLNGGAYAQKGNRLVSQSLTTGSGMNMPGATVGKPFKQPQGRWPSNVMLDEFTARLVDEQSGVSKSTGGRIGKKDTSNIDFGLSGNYRKGDPGFGDVGGASRYFFVSNERETDERVGTVETGNSRDGFVACESGECSLSDGVGQGAGVISGARFFYEPKASKRDRNEGLDELPEQTFSDREKQDHFATICGKHKRQRAVCGCEHIQTTKNFHPTVKPTDLMRQLVRLVTPPGGVVLDPFTGSGSTGKAAILEGFEFIGVELTDEYLPIIEGRLSHAVAQRTQAEADAVAAEAETLF